MKTTIKKRLKMQQKSSCSFLITACISHRDRYSDLYLSFAFCLLKSCSWTDSAITTIVKAMDTLLYVTGFVLIRGDRSQEVLMKFQDAERQFTGPQKTQR